MNGGWRDGCACMTVAATGDWRWAVWWATQWKPTRAAERGNEGTCYGDVSSSGHDVRIVLLRKVRELEESHSHSRSNKLSGGGCSYYCYLAQASGLPHMVDLTLRSRQHQSAQGQRRRAWDIKKRVHCRFSLFHFSGRRMIGRICRLVNQCRDHACARCV